MGKGRTRVVSGQNLGVLSTVKSGLLNIPSAPVYHPSEEEFRDPLEYVYKIRPEAEPYGICKIVPPKSWRPPFALDLDAFTFPTKTQAIHQLQARPAACDSKTFGLEYGRFLEEHCGKKLKKKVLFEGEELDLCKLFNAVKRFGGYDKVVKEKKWGEAFRFVRSNRKISECAKHVLCQLYRSHLYDYENYYNKLNKEVSKGCKRGLNEEAKSEHKVEILSLKRRRRSNSDCERVQVCVNVVKEEELDQICEQCRSGLHGEVMLLCDRCNKGWHIYCLSPPLKQVPPGNWYCLDCLNSDKDSFGFVPGKQFSLESFRRLADRAKKRWFGSGLASRVHLEKKFWEIVEGSAGRVEVMYGSDLDTSVYGSGFPRVNDQRPESVAANVWDEYCSSPWNLNNLPKLKGSMLQTVHHNITGVMVPWLYVGMLFSAFCWHFEDHCFYSMNYHHWGEPKCWYSVPGSEASAFEKVMRNSLPDLFDAQPDLLFQLVTMLNPSVLQENGVPVYSVLQEPGNFVITFPRSYHAGFNFGLNCAEAVNFAPADWLPHGGFGAELYQQYRKPAVLSHEELLCVVAKGDCDSRASPYLKKELLRIYTKERMWRECLWKKGIIRSRPMCSRKCPEYVGTEEDPTCIICQQYLYLSAVTCRCRPSAFVCLEHWEHLCECKSRKLHLLYRHTLAELHAMLLTVDKDCSGETSQSNNLRRQLSCSNQRSALTKKVKGGRVSLSRLAEEWLQRSRKIFQNPFTSDAYVTLLKEAEQFLWAGSEMDPVRHMVRNLLEAQRWAEGIRNCLSKVENWPNHHSCDVEKVRLGYLKELLGFDPVPCSEPGHLKLKNYAEEASLLLQEINATLSKRSEISELELLYARACDLPIYVEESDKLSQRISSAKVWIENVRKCISGKCPAGNEIEILYKLKSKILDLQVQLPETEILLNLIRQAESCRAKCSQMLNGSINLKDVEALLEELDGFTINVPELMLLQQYHSDAISWIARFNNIMVNIHERRDQHNVINELDCILKDGTSLRIRVDELPVVEVELKKARCRAKAFKSLALASRPSFILMVSDAKTMACDTKMPLDFIQHLMADAVVLQIDKEKLFLDMSEVVNTAMHWEERATHTLACKAQMSEFEDVIRTSEDIFVVLPSLVDVQDAVSVAKSWLKDSKPFLASAFSLEPISGSLNLEALKELVSQSKFLKISLEEKGILENILQKCEQWQLNATSLLQDVWFLLDMTGIDDGLSNGLMSKIEHLILSMESAIKVGLSLGFHFHEIPELENACSTLRWCNKALSFCSFAPSFQDVKSLMEVAESLSISCASSILLNSLYGGVRWLRRASEVISAPSKFKICKLSDVEEVLAGSQDISISFLAMVDELTSAVQEHKLWQDQVFQFFNLKDEQRSWSLMLQLKERGKATAFQCSDLERVVSEVDKVENWKQCCVDIVGASAGDVHPLLGALQKLKQSVDRSLNIYDKSRGFSPINSCMCCASGSEGQEFLTCSTCNDCYHLRCLRPAIDANRPEMYACHYCQLLKHGSISQNGDGPLKFGGKCCDLRKLIELLSGSENFCVGIEERGVLQAIVDEALACKTFLTDILKVALSYMDKDLSVISSKLTTALKAVEVAGVYDHQSNRALDLALARHSWRLKVDKLLEGSTKLSIQQIQHRLTEGLAMNISPEDYFRQKLTELNQICLQWTDQAKKVATDSGSSSLDKVFELIAEGETLPVSMEKELKLLRARSMLYCICRKPYDGRAMIACDQCDEWYHLACIRLRSSPKIFICAACKPEAEELLSTSTVMDDGRSSPKFVEPKTPSPTHTKLRKKEKKVVPSLTQKMLAFTNSSRIFNYSSGIDGLWWRNRKPFRRAARKRSVLENFSPFIHRQQEYR